MYDYYDIIENHKPIIYKDSVLEIPNAWYLTKDGTLYNSMGMEGHEQSALIYEVNDIAWKQIPPSAFMEYRSKYHDLYYSIKDNGYVTFEQCLQYLNTYIDSKLISNDQINHNVLMTLVLGSIKAHIDLYDAFNKLKEVNDYDESLKYLMELVRNQIDDLLVRFIHMSKVKHGDVSFICTTNPNTYPFREYIDRNYMIDVVDPIDVDNGEVKVLSLNKDRSITELYRSIR